MMCSGYLKKTPNHQINKQINPHTQTRTLDKSYTTLWKAFVSSTRHTEHWSSTKVTKEIFCELYAEFFCVVPLWFSTCRTFTALRLRLSDLICQISSFCVKKCHPQPTMHHLVRLLQMVDLGSQCNETMVLDWPYWSTLGLPKQTALRKKKLNAPGFNLKSLNTAHVKVPSVMPSMLAVLQWTMWDLDSQDRI